MTNWLSVDKYIQGIKGDILYVFTGDPVELRSILSALQFRVFFIEGEKVYDEDMLFHELMRTFEQEKFSEFNWGSCYDLLKRYFENTNDERISIIWTNANNMIENDLEGFVEACIHLHNLAASLRSWSEKENYRKAIQVEVFILR